MISSLVKPAASILAIITFANIAAAIDACNVFKSSDQGRTWVRSDTGIPEGSRVNAFGALGETVFAGTDSGVFISLDDANSWIPAQIVAAPSRRILSFANQGSKVFAGTDKGGLLISVDEGKTWRHSNALDGNKVRCLLAHEEKVYAGTDAAGVFVSDDGGKTWLPLEQEFPANAQVFALAMVQNRLFAGLYSKGLYVWIAEQPRWVQVGQVSPLVLAAIDGKLIAGHNPGGLYWSADLGATWTKGTSAVPGVPGELSSEAPVWELASNDEVTISGASEGIYYSEDGGRRWTRARTGLPTKSSGISFLLSRNFILAGTSVE